MRVSLLVVFLLSCACAPSVCWALAPSWHPRHGKWRASVVKQGLLRSSPLTTTVFSKDGDVAKEISEEKRTSNDIIHDNDHEKQQQSIKHDDGDDDKVGLSNVDEDDADGEAEAQKTYLTTCGVADENEKIRITCEGNVTVKEIAWASYGRPYYKTDDETTQAASQDAVVPSEFYKGVKDAKTCQKLAVSNTCKEEANNVQSTMEVVRNKCEGKLACTLEVGTNSFEWDPCFGQLKRIAVTVLSERGACSVMRLDKTRLAPLRDRPKKSQEEYERCANALERQAPPLRELAGWSASTKLEPSATAVPDTFRYPKIHVYDIPQQHMTCEYFRACKKMVGALKKSRYYAKDPSDADFFIIPYTMKRGGVRSNSALVDMFEWIRVTYPPYLANSIDEPDTVGPTHFIFTLCDHGPGDCLYERPITSMTPYFAKYPHYSANNMRRKIGFITLNGLRDGVDGNSPRDTCLVCFIRGIDIRIPQPEEHECGSLCGYGITELWQYSPWARALPENEDEWLTEAGNGRPNVGFFVGRIPTRNLEDGSARWPLRNFTHGVDGYRIFGSHELDEYLNYAKEMRMSRFCFVPLGQFAGDSDRYLPAILFGCIPVFLGQKSTQGQALPYDEVIDWSSMSFHVPFEENRNIVEIVKRYDTVEFRTGAYRAMSRAWNKLLYSRIYGNYMTLNTTESCDDDATQSFVDVLRWRLFHARKISASRVVHPSNDGESPSFGGTIIAPG